MRAFDFHCHVFDGKWKPYILTNALDIETCEKVVKYSDNKEVFCAVGIHPLSEYDFDKLNLLENFLEKAVAIGECGLDYRGDLKKQIEVFKYHINLAKEYDKPIIVHSRGCSNEVLKLLSNFDGIVIMHWFSGNEVKECLDRGYYFSIGPIINFTDAYNYLILESFPNNLLLETDSPVRYKGKESNPDWVYDVAKKVAEIVNTSSERVVEITTKNAFNIIKQ
jgi:TatD DNase family protein